MDIISAKALRKTYKDVVALDNLDVDIQENKIIGLIGKNGAGKSTLLKIIAGRIRQSSGELHVLDNDVFDNLEVLSKMIFVDEESSYNTTYKVQDILDLAKTYYTSWDDVLANKLIDHFNLKKDKKFRKLSRGMRTQVNVIVGICSRMPITILDEPTLGLDPAFRQDFYHILLNDFMKHPRTIIISSHLLNEIEMLLEEIILIDKGTLVMQTSMEEFSNYSVFLSGRTDFLSDFTKNKEVLSTSDFVRTSEYIIKNNLNEEELSLLKRNEVQVKSVSPQDLFIYLTNKGVKFDEF